MWIVHKPGAVLCDPSAAIALLWMRRTLQFLSRCLQGILDDESMSDVRAHAQGLSHPGQALRPDWSSVLGL